MAKTTITARLIGGPYNGHHMKLKRRDRLIKKDNPKGVYPCWYKRGDDDKYRYAGCRSKQPE